MSNFLEKSNKLLHINTLDFASKLIKHYEIFFRATDGGELSCPTIWKSIAIGSTLKSFVFLTLSRAGCPMLAVFNDRNENKLGEGSEGQFIFNIPTQKDLWYGSFSMVNLSNVIAYRLSINGAIDEREYSGKPVKSVSIVCAVKSGETFEIPVYDAFYDGKELFSTSSRDVGMVEIIKSRVDVLSSLLDVFLERGHALKCSLGFDSMIEFANLFYLFKGIRPGAVIDHYDRYPTLIGTDMIRRQRRLRHCIVSQDIFKSMVPEYFINGGRDSAYSESDIFHYLHNLYVRFNQEKLINLHELSNSEFEGVFRVELDEDYSLDLHDKFSRFKSLFSLDSSDFEIFSESLRQGFCLAFFTQRSSANDFSSLMHDLNIRVRLVQS